MNIKQHFEENMLDGDSVDDCGGAMLSAKRVFNYHNQAIHEERRRLSKVYGKITADRVKEAHDRVLEAINEVFGEYPEIDNLDDAVDYFEAELRTKILELKED